MSLLRAAALLTALSVPLAPVLGSPAHAFSSGTAGKNPWAGTGKLATQKCPEPPLASGGVAYPREYLGAMVKCLDKGWAGHFARAGRTFARPTVRYYDGPQREVCGIAWPEGASAFYCTDRRTLVLPLTGGWIEGRTDLYPLKVAAHEYGHHLQSLTGIRAAYERRTRTDALSRRYELQADCLAGVFLASVWRSLRRGKGDWAALVDAVRASGDDTFRTHGKGANRVYWLTRGYTTGAPASCDTWSAATARVS